MIATMPRLLLSFTVALLCIGAGPLRGQDSEEAIRKRLADRLPVIIDLKSKGKIGETWKGYLEAVKPDALAEEIEVDKKKTTVGALIDAENADRKTAYLLIAKRESTAKDVVPVEFVAERSAKDLFSRAEPGHMLLNEKGKWIQKPPRR